VRSIRVLQKKIIGDPYYDPTIVVHDDFSISDQLEKDWKEFCGNMELETNTLFWQYVTEKMFKKMLLTKLQSLQVQLPKTVRKLWN